MAQKVLNAISGDGNPYRKGSVSHALAAKVLGMGSGVDVDSFNLAQALALSQLTTERELAFPVAEVVDIATRVLRNLCKRGVVIKKVRNSFGVLYVRA